MFETTFYGNIDSSICFYLGINIEVVVVVIGLGEGCASPNNQSWSVPTVK